MPIYLKESDIDSSLCDIGSDFPLLTPDVGSGKTRYVFDNELKAAYEKASGKEIRFQLYLTPTEALKSEVLSRYPDNAVELDERDLACGDSDDGRIRVACVHKLGKFIQDGNEIKHAPDLLIFDELDLIAKWTLCHSDKLPVFDWLLSNRERTFVCGITATPQLLTGYVAANSDIPFVDLTPAYPANLKSDEISVCGNMSLKSYLKTLKATNRSKALVYTRGAKDCFRLAKEVPHSGFLVSRYNDDLVAVGGENRPLNQLMDEQRFSPKERKSAFGADEGIPLLDYVREYKELPQEVNILFINDAWATGINIEDESIRRVVVDSPELATIRQVRGRVRHDIDSLEVVYSFKEKYQMMRDFERANRFFFGGGKDDLEAWHAQEQSIANQCELANTRLPIDILTYRSIGGELRVNPFAYGFYRYQDDIYSKLRDDAQTRDYFNPLSDYSKSGSIRYLSEKEKSEIREGGNNEEKISRFDFSQWLGRELFAEDKERLAAELQLRSRKREAYTWRGAWKILQESGFYSVKDGKKKINGQEKRYSILARD